MSENKVLRETGSSNMDDSSPLLPKNKGMELTFANTYQPCIAELVGALIYVFVGTLSLYGSSTPPAQMGIALGHGFSMALLVASLGHIR